ncbi:MAG: VWA domain-containing protein [Ardenticatenaceae bacterium]|nr:VWA domain-containing protein [Ardenticatenaceae bacterium]
MSELSTPKNQEERMRRWRLILGKTHEDNPIPQEGEGDGDQSPPSGRDPLAGDDQMLDELLDQIYGESDDGDLSDSAPDIARWLGDIHRYFPDSVAQILQQDALDKYKLRKLLAYPELIQEIEPDVNLIAELLRLKRMLPAKTRETAREIVRKIVEELLEKLRRPMEQALSGTLNRAVTNRRPKLKEINWVRTIHSNLKHYQPRYQTVVPETVVGYGRKRSSLKDIILCVDTSASMGKSIVYASIYASVMASIPAISTRLILFDSSVVDMTGQLHDPVELLFGLRLGGGTDINRAITYAQQLVTRPRDTTLILISDLFEGGNKESLLQRVVQMQQHGIQMIVLLALNDSGSPRFSRDMALQLAALGVPAFACTPDLFPDLMSALLNGRDIQQWAAGHQVVTSPDN